MATKRHKGHKTSTLLPANRSPKGRRIEPRPRRCKPNFLRLLCLFVAILIFLFRLMACRPRFCTMQTISIHQAKTHFSRYLVAVESGEEFVIARGRKPVARLV